MVPREKHLQAMRLSVGQSIPAVFGDSPTVVRRKCPAMTDLQWEVFFTWVKYILDSNCFPQLTQLIFDFEMKSGKSLQSRREMARKLFRNHFHLSYYCNHHVELVFYWTDVVLQLTYIPRLCRLLAHNRAHLIGLKRKVQGGGGKKQKTGLGWPHVIWLELNVGTVYPVKPSALAPWEHLAELDWVINSCHQVVKHGIKIVFYFNLSQLTSIATLEGYNNFFRRFKLFIIGTATNLQESDQTHNRITPVLATHIVWRFDFNFLRRRMQYPTMIMILQNLETWFRLSIARYLPRSTINGVGQGIIDDDDLDNLDYTRLMSLRQIDVFFEPTMRQWTWCFHQSGIVKPHAHTKQ